MKNLKSYMISGAVFVLILGTLLHFAYDYLGQNIVVGLFTPVNESTWEHMKLVFFPMIICSIYFNTRLKSEFPCVNSAMAFATLVGTFLIPVLFYTYSGILGYNLAFFDISTFFISVIYSFYLAYNLTLSCSTEKYETLLSALLVIVGVSFIIFTLFPPQIGLFVSPA